MKTLLQRLIVLVLTVSGFCALAQTNFQGIPYKSMESPVYGSDVLIQGNASEDQRSAKIVIAPNGLIYAAYMISSGGFRVARSADNGTTWTHSATYRAGYSLNAIDLAVTGADTNTMNLWVVSTGYMTNSIDIWDVTVEKLDRQMAQVSSVLLDQRFANVGYPDVAIATDFAFPSAGASPFSIGVIYCKMGTSNDNIIFKSSADGGNTYANMQILVSTGMAHMNVALGFGRSPAFSQGRYFAAWDKQEFFGGDYFGQVLTAYTINQFDGSWSAPYRLDTIAGGMSNSAKDPSIACQADQVNNANGAFSVVVTYDKLLSGSNKCVYGAGNLNPVGGNSWSPVFSSGTGTRHDIEPDVNYDASRQNFYVAWSDSLNAKLKCAVNDVNLQTAGAWTPVSDGFNDVANISHPFPKVKVNPVTNQVVHVWDGHRSTMITNATFDKGDLYVGMADAAVAERFSFSVSPNPCQSQANLSFSLDREVVVAASLYDLSGRQVWALPSQLLSNGSHTVRLNTENLEPGCYIVQLSAGNSAGFQRIVVTPR
jgi:hypothetical protein